jgi:putative spermidine/putrescine transport system substrate-binding protein
VIVWDGQAPDYDLWAIPKGTPRLDLAYQFIAFSTRADNQANQTNYISYGPGNKDAIALIKPDVLKDLPSAPDNMKNAIIVDPQFWADKGEELRERFNAWLAQ